MNRRSRGCLCVNLLTKSISRDQVLDIDGQTKNSRGQANVQDFICYREFVDLDYAMPRQREGGVTWREISLAR